MTEPPSSASGSAEALPERVGSLNLQRSVAVGVGAIVGGGIFVLSGAMIAAAGPAALIALALNGLLALLTAMSFAELATAFPENGGEYAYARRAISVRSAFAVGWVVWFAYAVAAALYALGFASYFLLLVDALTGANLSGSPTLQTGTALLVTLCVALALARWGAVGGVAANLGKVLVFGVLIAGGLAAYVQRPIESLGSLVPFLPDAGGAGVFAAMGLSFIILQGFGNIAAVAGQVQDPVRTVPRAMFLSLGIALAIYAPLLWLILTVGAPPGGSVQEVAGLDPEAYFALAVRQWFGSFGWWLVVVAALLAMISALQASLIAAAGVTQAMAKDRTLPRLLAQPHAQWSTPVAALAASLVLVACVVLLLPNPSTAGAAASLIFLLCFALVHGLAWLVRRRLPADAAVFRAPLFPLVPALGGAACLAVALFQMALVPTAGWMTIVWLGFGLFFYFGFLAARAEALDLSAAAQDVSLKRTRGWSETVLVPVASPDSASGLVALASTLTPAGSGEVLLLQVVVAAPDEPAEVLGSKLHTAHMTMDNAVLQAHADGQRVGFLLRVATEPWPIIRREAEEHDVGAVLLGLPRRRDTLSSAPLNALLSDLGCDVALLCAPPGYDIRRCKRVLVPIGGSADHDRLRARALGSLVGHGVRHFTFLRVLPPHMEEDRRRAAGRRLFQLLDDEVRGLGEARVVLSDSATASLLAAAEGHDLILLGATRSVGGAHVLSPLLLTLALEAPCAALILSRRAG